MRLADRLGIEAASEAQLIHNPHCASLKPPQPARKLALNDLAVHSPRQTLPNRRDMADIIQIDELPSQSKAIVSICVEIR